MFRLAIALSLLLCSTVQAQVIRQRVMVCDENTCQMMVLPRVVPQPVVNTVRTVVSPVIPQATVSSVPQVTIRSSCNCAVTGVCTCPNCNCEHKTSNVSSASSAASVSATALRGNFRNSLMQAARQARKNGDITALEFFKIAAASRNAKMMEQIQAAVHESAIEEGLASTNAIDWDAIIEFIEKLIPLIIQLIDLFK